MRLLIVLLIIITIIENVVLTNIYIKKNSFLSSFTLGLSFALISYEIISAILFFYNSYTLFKSVLLSLVVDTCLFLCICIFNKFCFSIKLNKKELVLIVMVTAIVIFVGMPFNGVFGAAQDEGVYQIKALQLMHGQTDNNKIIQVFEKIDNTEKEDFLEWIEYNQGFRIDRCDNVLEGQLHGLPGLPAFMALFGSVFGIKYMQSCQLLFMIVSVLLLYMILDELSISNHLKTVSILVYLLSPQMVYMCKSALMELYFAMMMLLYIYLWLSKDSKLNKIAFIPVIAICFYHPTAFIILPFVIIINWIEYINSKNTISIFQCYIIVVGYLMGFWYEYKYNAPYLISNYSAVARRFFDISTDKVVYLVYSACFCAICITTFMFLTKFQIFLKNFFHHIKVVGVFVCVCLIIYACKMQISVYSFKEELLPSLIAFAFGVGGIFFIASILGIFKWLCLAKDFDYRIAMMFLYFILIFGAFFSVVTRYLYYYGRYLVPYLSILIITGACFIEKENKIWTFSLVISILLFFKQDVYLKNTYLDTQISWDAIAKIEEIVPEGSAIIIDDIVNSDIQFPRLYFVFDALGIDTYVIDKKDFPQQTLNIKGQNYKNLYLLSLDKIVDEDSYISEIIIDENYNYVYGHASVYYDSFFKVPVSSLKMNRELVLVQLY